MTAIQGWFWSDEYRHYQKRNKKLYCYVTPIMGGLKAQLYMTRNVSLCELEVQSFKHDLESVQKVFSIAEEWLEKYQDGDLSVIHQDKYSISNPEGVWRKDSHQKNWRI